MDDYERNREEQGPQGAVIVDIDFTNTGSKFEEDEDDLFYTDQDGELHERL